VGIFHDGLFKKDSPKTKAGNWVASIKTSAKEVCQILAIQKKYWCFPIINIV
jgi:hypothetical protein